MKCLVEYFDYRVIHALRHYGWPRDLTIWNYQHHSFQMCLIFNLETIINVLYFWKNGFIMQWPQLLMSFLIIIIAVSFFIKSSDKDKGGFDEYYAYLDNKYKNGKHWILYGWIIAIYNLLSFFGFIFILVYLMILSK